MKMPSNPSILLLDYPVAPAYRYDEETGSLAYVKKAAQALLDEQNGVDKTRRKIRKPFTTGLLTIGAYLQQHGYVVAYESLFPEPRKNLEEAVCSSDIILLTAMTPVYPFVRALARQLKQLKPDVLIVLGGYHASALPAEILREEPSIDIIVLGEGEPTMLALVRARQLVPGMPGVAMRSGEEVIVGPSAALLPGELIPTPDYTLLPGHPDEYRYHIQTIRGCPKRCGYCQNGFFWRSVRRRPLAGILQELHYLERIMGTHKEIHFTDNILTVSTKWLRELVEAYEASGLTLQFTADVKSDYIDQERLTLLQRLNVKKVYMGFEDANDQVLAAIDRKATLQENIQALTLIKEASSIKVEAYWMIGLPGTSSTVAEQNIRTVQDLIERDLLQSVCSDVLFVPLPGTPLFHQAETHGITILHRNWEDYHRSQFSPVFETATMSQQQLREYFLAFDQAVTESYLRKLGLTAEQAVEQYRQLLSRLLPEVTAPSDQFFYGNSRWGSA